MAVNYQIWIKMAQELGYQGDEPKAFKKKAKQAEAKEERLIEREAKKFAT